MKGPVIKADGKAEEKRAQATECGWMMGAEISGEQRHHNAGKKTDVPDGEDNARFEIETKFGDRHVKFSFLELGDQASGFRPVFAKEHAAEDSNHGWACVGPQLRVLRISSRLVAIQKPIKRPQTASSHA
jgi:hypothetical protein